MIAIGIGCRTACPGAEIIALVRDVMALLPESSRVQGLFSIVDKRGEPGLEAAAAALGLPLAYLERAALGRAAHRTKTRSARIEARLGLPSVAETAALVGAGTDAVLLVARRSSARATCAIAGPRP